MQIENEPELAAIFEGKDVPHWVAIITRATIAADPEQASIWTEELALAFGRRANRIVRERLAKQPPSETF